MSELPVQRSRADFDVAVIGTHIFPAVGYGGVAESLYNLVRAWASRGRAIRLCICDESKTGRLTAERIGLPPVVSISLYRAMVFRRWGFGFGAPIKILRACRRATFVYICGIATWPTTIAAALCALLRLPFVVAPRGGLMAGHVAEIRTHKPHKWLFYRLLTLPALRRARFIHVTSNVERQGVKDLLPQVHCETIVNGISLDDWKSRLPQDDGALRVLYAGRIEADKGIRRFARLWMAYRKEGDVLLIAGGGEGRYADEVKALARESGGAIELLGYLPRRELHGAYARASFVALPSGIEGGNARENFGNVVAEAMATGRPALVAKGLAWDFIEEDRLGFLFGATDEEVRSAIARARECLLGDYAEMCRRARCYAERSLSVEAAAELLWEKLSAIPRARTGSGLRRSAHP